MTAENLKRHELKSAEEQKAAIEEKRAALHKIITKVEQKEEVPVKKPEPEPQPEKVQPPQAPGQQGDDVGATASAKKEKEAAKPITQPGPESRQQKKKPMWALSEKQAEEVKEQEVDDLIEFAYQLDYEKFIEDFEVRQALAALKERVQELKKDDKWKENFAQKWNQQNAPQGEAAKDEPKAEAKPEAKVPGDNEDAKSVRSERSHKSTRSQAKSIKSMADTIKEIKVAEGEKPEWNKSVKGVDKITVEDKAAAQLADQVMQNAPVKER